MMEYILHPLNTKFEWSSELTYLLPVYLGLYINISTYNCQQKIHVQCLVYYAFLWQEILQLKMACNTLKVRSGC